MGHLLKIKCVDSRVNVHILASKSILIYTHDVANAKFRTNSHETDYSGGSLDLQSVETKTSPFLHSSPWALSVELMK